jgi:dipeptidyl aminopeptidase/acylaminoacyl peptidase
MRRTIAVLLLGLLPSVPIRSLSAAADPPAAETRPVVSEAACATELIKVATPDGHETDAVVRRPPGPGPFPVLVHLHGGLNRQSVEQLKGLAAEPTAMRFLVAGYIMVHPTFRSRQEDPQTRDALVDCLAVVERARSLPGADPRSVVVWGDSGGGSLALELAGEATLAAAAAQEPATVLFTGIFNTKNRDLARLMASPRDFYTTELEQFTREKIRKIHCPVFIAHGDVHPINKINNEIVIPAMKEAGKPLELIVYPGERHGFSRRSKKFFDDCHAFFRRHLATQPRPLPDALVTQVPVGS